MKLLFLLLGLNLILSTPVFCAEQNHEQLHRQNSETDQQNEDEFQTNLASINCIFVLLSLARLGYLTYNNTYDIEIPALLTTAMAGITSDEDFFKKLDIPTSFIKARKAISNTFLTLSILMFFYLCYNKL